MLLKVNSRGLAALGLLLAGAAAGTEESDRLELTIEEPDDNGVVNVKVQGVNGVKLAHRFNWRTGYTVAPGQQY